MLNLVFCVCLLLLNYDIFGNELWNLCVPVGKLIVLQLHQILKVLKSSVQTQAVAEHIVLFLLAVFVDLNLLIDTNKPQLRKSLAST